MTMAKAFKISDYVQPEDGSKMDRMEITMVPFERIFQNWRNFYAVDNQEEELAESIKVSGLLTPLGVVQDGAPDRFKLISGHRRWRALRYLRDSEPDGRTTWATVPCVIYDSPEDSDREQLMLIHANAQRVKSGAEIAREARETTEILTRMKERGVELPGRMRDRVAEALQVSSTRLARLEAIENNLTYPGWERKWTEQKINEAVAYRLSQLDYSQQMHTADWMIDHHVKDADITVKLIEEALAHPPLTNPGCADPLFYEEDPVKVDRELVRRMDAMGYLSGVHFANRKDGMDQLKLTFRNWGHGSAELEWDGEPKGVRFKKPVEWLLGWGAMYDALAANALDAAIEGATTGAACAGKDPSTSLRSAQDDKGAPVKTVQIYDGPGDPEWSRFETASPPDGQLIATTSMGGAWMADIWRYHNGEFYTPNDRSYREPCEIDPGDDWWAPLPEFPEEV